MTGVPAGWQVVVCVGCRGMRWSVWRPPEGDPAAPAVLALRCDLCGHYQVLIPLAP